MPIGRTWGDSASGTRITREKMVGDSDRVGVLRAPFWRNRRLPTIEGVVIEAVLQRVNLAREP
ncbi:hypothetical protein H8E77_05550 [bacterium]|nr:hypothetical protein [bacterium]